MTLTGVTSGGAALAAEFVNLDIMLGFVGDSRGFVGVALRTVLAPTWAAGEGERSPPGDARTPPGEFAASSCAWAAACSISLAPPNRLF